MEKLSIPKLNTVPAEILTQTCVLIDETHKPSLQSFAIVSSRLHLVAVGFLFRNITIRVQDLEQLRNDIEKLSPTVLDHVRNLTTEGMMPKRETRSRRKVEYLPPNGRPWVEHDFFLVSNAMGRTLDDEYIK